MDERELFSQKIGELVKEHAITSIVDYGCGEGELLKRIHETVSPGLTLFGIDYFSRFPEEKRPASEGALRFIDKDSDDFATFLAEQDCGLVITTWAFHHFEYPLKELKTMHSMLRKGGFVFLVDFHFSNESDAERVKNFFSFVDEAYLAFKGSYHRHHYTLKQAFDIIEATPFEVLSHELQALPSSEEENREVGDFFKEHMKKRISLIQESSEGQLFKEYFSQQYSQIIDLIDTIGYAHGPFFMIVLQKK